MRWVSGYRQTMIAFFVLEADISESLFRISEVGRRVDGLLIYNAGKWL